MSGLRVKVLPQTQMRVKAGMLKPQAQMRVKMRAQARSRVKPGDFPCRAR